MDAIVDVVRSFVDVLVVPIAEILVFGSMVWTERKIFRAGGRAMERHTERSEVVTSQSTFQIFAPYALAMLLILLLSALVMVAIANWEDTIEAVQNIWSDVTGGL